MGHASNNADPKLRSFIDALLTEQGSLTAVERFSHACDRGEAASQQRRYSSLLPASPPAPGQQYAFEVDLDKCSGCKACVTACHSLNGLDDDETWRDVGLLYSEDWRAPFQQTVTTACHHCVDPGCLSGCPVLAYEKDPLTGIVHHLDDQCIGCQYCVMKCPYEVPQYSAKRGIVRKCDMCSSRLGAGEAPACVQACPGEAIRITVVEQAEVISSFRGGHGSFLPASPAPEITLPTTRFSSAKPLPPGLLAGDHARVKPADPHWPLVFMLVLSQLAVGAAVATVFVSAAAWTSLLSAIMGAAAIGIGFMHLGRPLKAWRAFLGWRTSWFSREVIAFAIFLPLALLSAATRQLALLAPLQEPLAIATAVVGIACVACSAMLYADTRREFWSAPQSFGKFFGTTALLSIAASLVLGGIGHPVLALALIVISAAKLGFENRIHRHRVDENEPAPTPLSRTARLLAEDLGLLARCRAALMLMGGVLLPLLFALGWHSSILTAAILAFCLSGEFLERYLFFRAMAPAKMPGGVAS